ncbi:MAG TPA: MTH1187 family thiamine-binding protein [Desulfurivibrionaceae bacterium]|nr:MTH1187 family thiamine-binding protein [Desulfurivibrionaceae bacterium]
MALMQITIIPLGTASVSVGDHVAAVQRLLTEKGVPHQLNDMGTLIEGEPAALLQLAAAIHELPFQHGCQRIVTQIVLDDRRDKQIAIGDKTAAVKQRLAGDNSILNQDGNATAKRATTRQHTEYGEEQRSTADTINA